MNKLENKYRQRAFYLGRKMYWYGFKTGIIVGLVACSILMLVIIYITDV